MSELPPINVQLQRLAQWYTMKEELRKLQAAEVLLRRELFGEHFPTPSEGTNSVPLPDGYKLNGIYKIDRKVDEAALDTLKPTLREKDIPVDALIKYKPELAVREYRKLQDDTTEEGKKRLNLFDQCLIIRPSETPTLEVVLPAKAKK